MSITISRNGAGIPPTRPSRQPIGFLEATVTYTDGRSAIEHDERNDARGRKAMDAWCWQRNESARVDYIAVAITSRRAGYRGGR